MSQRVRLCKSHTTCIPQAARIRDAARKMPEVTAVSAGFIRAGVRPGRVRVKIGEATGCLLLTIRGVTAVQELRVYSSDIGKTKLDLAAVVRRLRYGLAAR